MPYISRLQTEEFLLKAAQAVQQPATHPVVLQIYGIGGVGKSTLLARLKENQKQTQVVKVSFGETEEIDDPIQLMKKLHGDLEKQYPTPKGLRKDVRDILTKPDPFSKLYEQFWDTSHQLQTQSVDGKAVSDEQLELVKRLLREGVSGVGQFVLPEIASKTLGKAAELSVDTAKLVLSEKDRLLQRHPATKAKRELQELIEQPIPKLTQAFTESLILRSKKCPIILILDTYEKAQPDIDRWLWRSLLCNTELQPYPIRLVVASRYPLTRELEWRKLRDCQLLWEQSLERFDWKQTEQYLQEIGITSPDQITAIWQKTKGLPKYLSWVRRKHDANQEFDFSQAGQEIEDLLLEGLSNAEKQVVRQAACCNWFDRRVIQHLLSSQEERDWFEWLSQQHFVEFAKGRYRFDDVARDVFWQALWYDDRSQFQQTHVTLASYFEAEANQEVAPESLPSAKYKNSEWRGYRSEFLYHALFARLPDVQLKVITHLLECQYFQEDIFSALRGNLHIDTKLSRFLGQDLAAFLGSITGVLMFGLPLMGRVAVEHEDFRRLFTPEVFTSFKSHLEASVNTCFKFLNKLERLAKFAVLIYKSQWCPPSQQLDFLHQAKQQAEQIAITSDSEYSSGLFLRIGHEFLELKQFEEAIAAYDQAVAIDPDDYKTWMFRGLALYELGSVNDLIALSRNLSPSSERFRQEAGTTNIQYLEAAVESFNRALDIKPDEWNIYEMKTIALGILGRFEEELESYDRALAIKPDDPKMWCHRGHALHWLERHEEAIASFDQSLAIDPDYLEAWNFRRLVPGGLGREEEAIASYDRALAINPKNPQVLFYRGCALADLKRDEEALASFDQVIEFDRDNHEAWSERGSVLDRLERREDAIVSYEHALAIDPNSWINWSSVGLLQSFLGRNESAVDSFNQALSKDPGVASDQDVASILRLRGRALANLNRHEEALASCDEAIALEADNSKAHHYRGKALSSLNRYEEAIASLDKAIAIEPDAYEAWSDRGFALWKLERLEEAIANFDQAITIKPDLQEADFWLRRGATLFMLNRFEDAIDSYDKVLQVEPNNYEVWDVRGSTLSLLERYEEAVTSYDRAITINPKHHEAWLQKIAVLNQLGQQVEAILTLKCALEANPNNPNIPQLPEGALKFWRKLEEIGGSEFLRGILEKETDGLEILRKLEETGNLESLRSLLEETDEKAS